MRGFFLLFSSVYFFCACDSQRKITAPTDGFITTESGLRYKILQKGSGPQAKVGQEVLIRETTTYLNGTILYSNENTDKAPVKVLIGGNQATNAVDEGLRGMRVGEIRQLIATPNLVKRKAYPANVSPDSSLAIKVILQQIL